MKRWRIFSLFSSFRFIPFRETERDFQGGEKGRDWKWSRIGKYAEAGGKRFIAEDRIWGECLVWLKREYNVLIRSVIVLRACAGAGESSNVSHRWSFVDSTVFLLLRLIDRWCFARRLIIRIERVSRVSSSLGCFKIIRGCLSSW